MYYVLSFRVYFELFHVVDYYLPPVPDLDYIPTLDTLQKALLNDDDEMEELMSLLNHLLKFALDDPGVPNPKEVI